MDVAVREILIVDDNEFIRDTLIDFLSFNGYEVFMAVGGSEALKILKGKHFSIVVTDLNMPIMNGIELIKAVRNLNMPLTIIGMSTADREQEFLKAGADYFLPKPFYFPYLKSILNSIFEQ